MRRELKELAKLAETMRKESEVKASADFSEYEPEAAQLTADPALSASSLTVPPVVPPSVPPPATSDFDDLPQHRGRRGGLRAVFVGAGVAAVLVGTAALGRSLVSRHTMANAPAPETATAAAALPPSQPIEPPAAPAPVAESPVIAEAPAAPPPAGAPAAAPHRRSPAAAPRRAVKAVPVKVAVAAVPPEAVAASAPAADTPPSPPKAAAAKPPSTPGAAQATSGDTLEDMIRKAVAAPTKK